MATTVLNTTANRQFNRSFLYNTVATVAADAAISEFFILPTGYGQLQLEWAMCYIGTFSGAYVAPAPAYDGPLMMILSPDAATYADGIGSRRFVHTSTTSARPELFTSIDLIRPALVRQTERIWVRAPILAGAGVTVTVGLFLRGVRFSTQ